MFPGIFGALGAQLPQPKKQEQTVTKQPVGPMQQAGWLGAFTNPVVKPPVQSAPAPTVTKQPVARPSILPNITTTALGPMAAFANPRPAAQPAPVAAKPPVQSAPTERTYIPRDPFAKANDFHFGYTDINDILARRAAFDSMGISGRIQGGKRLPNELFRQTERVKPFFNMEQLNQLLNTKFPR